MKKECRDLGVTPTEEGNVDELGETQMEGAKTMSMVEGYSGVNRVSNRPKTLHSCIHCGVCALGLEICEGLPAVSHCRGPRGGIATHLTGHRSTNKSRRKGSAPPRLYHQVQASQGCAYSACRRVDKGILTIVEARNECTMHN